MSKLLLNFLQQPQGQERNIISILEDRGQQIEQYAPELFKSTVVTTVSERNLLSCSLYILASEIRYDYKAIAVETKPDSTVTVRFFALATQKIETKRVDISKGLDYYESILDHLLSSDLFNASLKFLKDQIDMKREYAAE